MPGYPPLSPMEGPLASFKPFSLVHKQAPDFCRKNSQPGLPLERFSLLKLSDTPFPNSLFKQAMDIKEQIHDLGRRARIASKQLAQLSTEQKNAGLRAMADELISSQDE